MTKHSITKQAPATAHVYKTLAACCHYRQIRPSGAQPVFDAATKKPLGFAQLPDKEAGVSIYWVR